MKILVICYSYAPNIDPRALRWTALCEAWSKLGHEVHVVAGHQPAQQREETRQGVHLHRVGGGWLSSVRQWAAKPDTVTKSGDTSSVARENDKPRRSGTLLSGLLTGLKIIHDLTWKRLYWPDSNCLWILPAARYGRRLVRQVQFDALVSVSHPFSDHVVGLIVGCAAPEISWLADSGDPFAFSKESAPNNFSLYRKVNYWVEGKVLAGVKYFSVTTHVTADIYQTLFPAAAHKVIVIPPLLQDSLLEMHIPEVSLFDSDAIVLLFVGAFYRDIRSPVSLFDLLLQVIEKSQTLKQKLQLHIIGSTDVIAEEIHQYPQLRERVVLHGKLPHAEAVSAMHAANCLVNIGNATHYQLPSKVIEYMATGKPILNIYSIEGDSSANTLLGYPFHLNVRAGQYEDIDLIVQFVEQSPNYVLNKEDVHQRVAGFKAQSIANSYLHLLFNQAGPE